MPMKKVLILVNGLYVGGFSKSLINLLYCMQQIDTDIEISLYNFDVENSELLPEVPSTIEVFNLPKSNRKPNFICKLKLEFYKLKYLIFERFCRFFNAGLLDKNLIRYIQEKQSALVSNIKAELNFASDFDYDVVISWEEVFCNYALIKLFGLKNKVGMVHPNYLEAKFSKKVDKHFFKKMDRIITVSKSCEQTLKNVFPDLSDKISCIPNRLSRNYYYELADKYQPELRGTVKLLTVSRIDDKSKALLRGLRIIKRLLERYTDICWYIVGGGPDFNLLQKNINELGINDNVVCLGSMSNPYPYMKQADLYIQQSYYEGRPVSVDEAMLLGTPSLVTNYSSAHEQVDDGINGWVVDNSEQAIYEKLLWLLDHPQEIKKARDNLKKKDFSEFEDCSAFINMIYELT